MRSITTNEPLTQIVLHSGELLFAKISDSEFEKLMSNEFIKLNYHGGRRIKPSNIKEYGPATGINYFKIMVLPNLPEEERIPMDDLLVRAEAKGNNPSLNAVLHGLEAIRKEIADKKKPAYRIAKERLDAMVAKHKAKMAQLEGT